ncbi:NAD-dependent epimerase/dehydratase family protein [Palleronia abyssalis]|uniref:UDP-glucose 4-epimerase n=1 Tax=Palleronia abyssalis TaxID=1501240 RepID=A0A2R8BU42_9RHOB|nr:NAD(P)-dependent oxidoreductase [Palleronia abyssalis]SPJ23653.1 UDP-glucose 4-epimerase [Palleronia abyssalis]
MRVLFTGGSGKAGRHVVPFLIEQGHEVVNFDLTPLDVPGVKNLIGDVTAPGDVWGALTQPADFDELEGGDGVKPYDAVVHFAAIPRIMIKPDHETFRVNTMGTYTVIEAALGVGIRKVIFASSETTYGICFADGERKPEYIPVDEEHPVVPGDSYAMSKVANEVTARSFQQRSKADIYGLRINNVMEPHEYKEKFPFADAAERRRNIFAYIDARDLGHMVDLCLKTDGLGFEVFNVANPEPSVDLTSGEITARFYQGVPQKREMAQDETFYSIEKAQRMLGFAPKVRWRDEV